MKCCTVVVACLLHASLLVLLLEPLAFGQTTAQRNPPLVISSMSGQDLFEFYCASCHGRDGRGQGPVVPSLKSPPPDLTTIARRNGGIFPRARVESLVSGDREWSTTIHGSKEMPVWGPIFRGLDASDTMNKVRIANIVGHIEAMQAK